MTQTTNSSISTLKNQFDQIYFKHINETNPQKVEDAIKEMVNLQTKMESATRNKFPSLSEIFNWGATTTNTFSANEMTKDGEIKLTQMLAHSSNLYSKDTNSIHTYHKTHFCNNEVTAPADKKNAIDYATGFSNMSNNCWANSLLSMIICVQCFELAYVTVANYYAHSIDDVASHHGKALQDALKAYHLALSNKQPVSEHVSQNVRLAFAHFFGEFMFSTSCDNPEDAGEALQMLMGRYEEILREKNHRNPAFSSLYCPLETKRCYQPTGEQRGADPYKISKDDYSKMGPDHSSSVFCKDYQILIDLQGKGHLSFEALLSGYFINSCVGDCDKSTYLMDNGFVQDFKLVEELRQFKGTPNEFFLVLKRFSQDLDGTRNKISTGVKINRMIALPEIATDQNKLIAYELDSFIVHSGKFGGGHYICFKKIDNRWIKANDSRVSFKKNEKIDQILHNANNSDYTSYLHHYSVVPPTAQAAAIESIQLAMRPETVITVKCPNLPGNQTLSIRGNGAGLNWNNCVKLTQIDWETFEFKTNVPFTGELEYKFLIDGAKWERGANHKITEGKRAECIHSFEQQVLPPVQKTVIEVSCFVPSGKTLSLSGTGPLGNWDQLIPMRRIGHSDRWYLSLEGEFPSFQYKLRLSSGEWEQGSDRSATCGKKGEIKSPHF